LTNSEANVERKSEWLCFHPFTLLKLLLENGYMDTILTSFLSRWKVERKSEWLCFHPFILLKLLLLENGLVDTIPTSFL